MSIGIHEMMVFIGDFVTNRAGMFMFGEIIIDPTIKRMILKCNVFTFFTRLAMLCLAIRKPFAHRMVFIRQIYLTRIAFCRMLVIVNKMILKK